MKIFSHLRQAALAVLAIAVLSGAASAADEKSRRDVNQVPTLLGLSTFPATGEIRNIRATSDGYLLVVTTGSSVTGSVTSAQGTAAATAGAWPTKVTDGTDTADVTAASALKVDGSAVTQPVSAASLPLPSGAATSANQTTSNSSLSSIDGKLPSTVAADRTTAGSPSSTRLSDGSSFYKATTPSDTQPVSAASLPLPTGAATEATASTIAGDTTSLDAKVPSQGQAAMAASLPVVIASNQTAVPVSDGGGALTVDGTVSAAQSGSWSVTSTADSFATPEVSTGSCASGSATAAITASATAKGTIFTNEGVDPVRVGGSGVTSAIGLLVPGESSVVLDGEGSAFRGQLFCISTTGSAMAFSTFQGKP